VTAAATPAQGRRGRGPLPLGGAGFSLGGAAVCLAVVPAQLRVSLAYGLVFAIVAVAQAGLAVGLLVAPTRQRLAAATAVSLAVVAVWVLARTVGLPDPNPWLPFDTTVGFTDWLCAALEVLAAVLLGWALVRWPRRPRVRRPVLVGLASLPPLLLAAVLAAGGVGLATDGFSRFAGEGGRLPDRLPPGGAVTVTYCTEHGTKLAMDLYAPLAGAARPAPAVLYVHGGGFALGNRRLGGLGGGLANAAGALAPQLRAVLNRRGFLVASIDYRLPPLSPWPAQLQDARCAVRFLRAQAGALGIDPGRIGAWGSSAGGTLVALLGLAGPQTSLDADQPAVQASTVQAVADLFGAADLSDLGDSTLFARTVARIALGGSPRVRRAASPLTYVPAGPQAAAGVPPFLLLHGTDDQDMPPRHAQELARRLAAAGAPVRLVLVQGAAHGLNSPGQRPTPDQLTELVADFLTRSLAPGRSPPGRTDGGEAAPSRT
jgi:acetyl esterase/lipase